MTRPLSFDHLQAILRQHTAGLPDVRKPRSLSEKKAIEK